MSLKKYTGASNLQGHSESALFSSPPPAVGQHMKAASERFTPLHGAIQLVLVCVSLWVLDTLSHFVIPIWQKEKQKLGELERPARIALDIAAAAALAWCPGKPLPPVLVLTFGLSRVVLPVAVVQTASISWHKMALHLMGCSTRPVSFPRKQLPTDGRLHFLMKLWVSSLREWRSLSQSEKLQSVPHSAAVCGISACLNLTHCSKPNLNVTSSHGDFSDFILSPRFPSLTY